MNIKIIVAAHKRYVMPEDDIYLPVHAGCEGKESIGFQGDNTGDNISLKNPYYCELTCLYWAWKNLDCDFLGLAHYRRHFSLAPYKRNKFQAVLNGRQLVELLKKNDIILPNKRNYYIETIYSHYAHTHDSTHLDKTKEIIKEKYPDYIPAFDEVMKSRKAHMFNMFIMKKALADSYCEWLFDVLGELEKHIDISEMNAFDARLFGRVSERLLDVWLIKNNMEYCEIPHIHTEPINWFRKITGFLCAKFFGKKYNKSC